MEYIIGALITVIAYLVTKYKINSKAALERDEAILKNKLEDVTNNMDKIAHDVNAKSVAALIDERKRED